LIAYRSPELPFCVISGSFIRLALKAVLAAPDRTTYADVSTASPQADEFDNLDLYHATSGGEAVLARKRRDDALRERGH